MVLLSVLLSTQLIGIVVAKRNRLGSQFPGGPGGGDGGELNSRQHPLGRFLVCFNACLIAFVWLLSSICWNWHLQLLAVSLR